MNRGDVVLVPFPFQDRLGEKIRPAVVVQSDSENRRLANTILAMITGNLDDAGHPTNVVIDPGRPEARDCGLRGVSLVKFCNLAAVRHRRILHVLGHLSPPMMGEVDLALKSALGL